MQIEHLPGCLRIHFQQDFIRTLQYDRDGHLTISNGQGVVIANFQTVASVSYNAQYGTPVSKDQQFVFIGTWEKGLFCYSIKRQELVWRVGPGRVRNIVEIDDFLLVEMAGRGIYRRDVSSGDLLEIIKMSAIDRFKQLNNHELFAGPYRGKYLLFDLPAMQPKKQYKISSLNINNSLSFVIQDVYYQDTALYIKGFEQHKGWNHADEEQTAFVRPITPI